jgi:hypothetical protein
MCRGCSYGTLQHSNAVGTTLAAQSRQPVDVLALAVLLQVSVVLVQLLPCVHHIVHCSLH